MNLIKTLMGRRRFMIGAGLVSTSALALKTLGGIIDPVFKTSIASAAEKVAGGTKGGFNSAPADVKKIGDLKCMIIYFSLTGNTEKIARAIQKGILQAAGNCDLIPMKDADPYKLQNYDLIGFGNPIMGSMRFNTYNFINSIRGVGGKHLILFSTAHSGGNNFNALYTLFKEHGLIFLGGRAYKGAEYGPLGEPCPTAADGHPDKIDVEDAEAFGKQMAENSRLIYAGNTTLIPEPPKTVDLSTIAELDWKKHMEQIHWRLIFDKSKCLYPKCRLCMDFCPVHGIDLTVDPPVLANPCLPCGMCDQICPTGAATVDPIQMRWQNAIHDYEKTGRQTLVKLKQGIKEEERRRPSSPYGPTNTKQYLTDEQVAEGYLHQVYKVFNKRPRFVIGYGRPYGVDPRTLEDRGPAPENWPE
jgi:flavodoxin/Fe-S-cluster-containing hydrogenase component 2